MIICSHCSTVNHPDNVVCSHCGSPLVPDPALDGDPYVGRTLGSRFLLEQIVGSGEIGMVYRGVDQRSQQPVAVKIVHPDVAATHGDELLHTARELSRLRHAKVATVMGAARSSDGTTFIVTEFIQGQTLKALLDANGPLGARRAADILFQLCSALVPIHRAGRPHCNLKPENVFLVERDDGTDFVKIVDAGSPTLFGVKETAGGEVIIGTPKYFSPEQALGRTVGQASDQFSLGIIGYQLLTGALPFFGATPDQLLSAIANGTPTPVNQRSGGRPLPDKLEEVINRCLEKDPNRRYPDLRSIATDLATVIKSTQAAPTPRKTFGQGRNLNTVVAGPDLMAALRVSDEDDDDEATALRHLPVDIEALLRSSSPAPAMTSEPVQAPTQSIPEPLMYTGALSQAELEAQLAASRPRGPSGPSFGDHDLSAALAAAAAEADGRALSAPPEAALPQPPPPPEDTFDPFGDMELPPAAPRPERPAAGRPVPSPELSNAIFDAISEELNTVPAPAATGAAAPLATAADFAALSPDVIRQAQDVAAQVEAEAPKGGGSSPALLALVGLLVVGLAAGAVWWFVLRTPEPQTPARIAAPQPKPAPKVALLKAPVTVRLLSTPPGAQVKAGDAVVGVTPVSIELTEARPYTWTLTLAGHAPATQTYDPTGVVPGEAPVPLATDLAEAPGAAPESAAPESAAAAGAAVAKAPKKAVATDAPKPAAKRPRAATRSATRANPPARPARPKRKPKTDPNKLKNPFD